MSAKNGSGTKNEDEIQAWICIVNKRNFEIIKEKRIYGVPNTLRAMRLLNCFRKNDLILFYVINPVKKIEGICKVMSPVFQEFVKEPWSDRLYPFRIRISEVTPFVVSAENFLGKISAVQKSIPMGASIIHISKNDLEKLRKLASSELVVD